MMALIYAVQGSFWPLLAVHLADLGIGGRDRGWIFATLAIGSTAVPLGAGQLVDRLMATQRVLAMIYALGTGLLVVLASGWVGSAGGLFAVFLVYWVADGPGLQPGQLAGDAQPRRPGPGVRPGAIWGTAGWMVAGWVVSLVMAVSGSTRTGQGAYEALWVAAGVLRGHVALLPDPAPHAAAGRRPPRGGDPSRRASSSFVGRT